MQQTCNVKTTEDKNPKHTICSLYFLHTYDLDLKVIKHRMIMLTPSKVIIMQSLEDLALVLSKKKPMFKVFPNEEICLLSPLHMCENQKQWYIYNLLDVINNLIKFQLNRIRTSNFQLKLFDTAVTLKYNQGH